MSNFYVVKIGASQQKVSVGQEITVDRMDAEPGSKVKSSEILLSSIDDEVKVGKPSIEKLNATFEVVSHVRGEKVYVRKFKAKSRYHKRTGFRADLTVLKLLEVK